MNPSISTPQDREQRRLDALFDWIHKSLLHDIGTTFKSMLARTSVLNKGTHLGTFYQVKGIRLGGFCQGKSTFGNSMCRKHQSLVFCVHEVPSFITRFCWKSLSW